MPIAAPYKALVEEDLDPRDAASWAKAKIKMPDHDWINICLATHCRRG